MKAQRRTTILKDNIVTVSQGCLKVLLLSESTRQQIYKAEQKNVHTHYILLSLKWCKAGPALGNSENYSYDGLGDDTPFQIYQQHEYELAIISIISILKINNGSILIVFVNL